MQIVNKETGDVETHEDVISFEFIGENLHVFYSGGRLESFGFESYKLQRCESQNPNLIGDGKDEY